MRSSHEGAATSAANARPGASRALVQVGAAGIAFLLVLPAAGLGLLVRTAVPNAPLPGAEEDGAWAARNYLPRDHVASRFGSLQEILAHPDIIPTHGHPLLGRQAPDFELADPEGKVWNLGELRDGRPVVLIFYYGYHCVACVRQLFDVNRDLPLFREVGARVVAISPDPPELTRQRFQSTARSTSRSFRIQETRWRKPTGCSSRCRMERRRTSAVMGLLSSTGMARFSGSMLGTRRSVAVQRCSTNWPRWKTVWAASLSVIRRS